MTDIMSLQTAYMAVEVWNAAAGKSLTSHLSRLTLDPDSGVYEFTFHGYPARGGIVAKLTVEAARDLTEFVERADGLKVTILNTREVCG